MGKKAYDHEYRKNSFYSGGGAAQRSGNKPSSARSPTLDEEENLRHIRGKQKEVKESLC